MDAECSLSWSQWVYMYEMARERQWSKDATRGDQCEGVSVGEVKS